MGFCRKSSHAKKCFGIPQRDCNVLNLFSNIKFVYDLCLNTFEVLRSNHKNVLAKIKQYEMDINKLIEENSNSITQNV